MERPAGGRHNLPNYIVCFKAKAGWHPSITVLRRAGYAAVSNLPGALSAQFLAVEGRAVIFSFRWVGRNEPEFPKEFLDRYRIRVVASRRSIYFGPDSLE